MENGNFWVVIIFIIISFAGTLLKNRYKKGASEWEYIEEDEALEQPEATQIDNPITNRVAREKPMRQRSKVKSTTTTSSAPQEEEAQEEKLFTTMDEVKKAIITAEILQRKF